MIEVPEMIPRTSNSFIILFIILVMKLTYVSTSDAVPFLNVTSSKFECKIDNNGVVIKNLAPFIIRVCISNDTSFNVHNKNVEMQLITTIGKELHANLAIQRNGECHEK